MTGAARGPAAVAPSQTDGRAPGASPAPAVAGAAGGRRVRRPVAYLRVRPTTTCAPGDPLTVGDVAELRGPDGVVARVRAVSLGTAPGRPGPRVVSLLDIVAAVERAAPEVRWHILGDGDAVALARVPQPHRWWWAVFAWLLLFVGAATTLLNFHADVNMPAAHRELYRLATGRRSARPMAVEVPYAIGVGLGALLFFLLPSGGGAPGPLELEIDRYESRLAAYFRNRAAGRRR